MDNQQYSEQLKKALAGINKLKAKINEIESKAHEPIAIIGMSCRFPQAKNKEAFWDILRQGKHVITPIPVSRWDNTAYYDPDLDVKNKYICPYGGFLENVDQFDSSFFNIAPGEAPLMDPQQRIILEEAYHAFEDAGLTQEQLKSSLCGVYIGLMNTDYQDLLIKYHGDNRAGHELMGNSGAILAARISYFFDLHGPNMMIDTACSSSLVALHEACISLRLGESEIALAGGITLHLSPERYILMSKAGMLSPDGACKTFSNDANGFVPGDGAGLVVLKPLSKALQDHDKIYAVIKGSIVNQDGKTNGITVPNALAQTDLESTLYQQLKLDPGDISYVEAHGTGTKIGDPIEVEGLTAAFSQHTQRKNYCAIGSVKSNIGHTVAAAGIASVIKVSLALKNQTLVPTLHVTRLNDYIDFQNSPFYVNTECIPWEPINQKRVACVSSFGFSGTNAHIVLEEAPIVDPVPVEEGNWVICLSAKTPDALKQLIQDYVVHLETHPEERIQDIVFSTNNGRTQLEHKACFGAATREQLLANLKNMTPSTDVENTPVQGNKISLPAYPFERQHYWFDVKRIAHRGTIDSPFIYHREMIPEYGLFFEAEIDPLVETSLQDHVVLSHPLFPGAGLVELVLEATQTLDDAYRIDELTLERPLELKRSTSLKLMLREDSTRYQLILSDAEGTRYLGGVLSPYTVPFGIVSLSEVKESSDVDAFYTQLDAIGLNYGPAFRRIKSIQKSKNAALAKLSPVSNHKFCIHPAELDSALQLIALLAPDHHAVYLPFQFKNILFNTHAGPAEKAYVQLVSHDDTTLHAKVQLLDHLNQVRLEIGEFHARKADKKTLDSLLAPKQNSVFACGEWQLIHPDFNKEQPEPLVFHDVSQLTEIQALLKQNSSPRLVFVTRNNEPGELLGFVKSLILEYPHAAISLIDIEHDTDLVFALNVANEPIISCRNETIYAWRLKTCALLPERYQLVKANNQISDLNFIEQERPEVPDTGVEIALQATGLNFRDVLNAMGLYPGDPGPLGCEGAGVITRIGKKVTKRAVGERIFGYCSGGFSTYTLADEHLVVPIPDGLNLAQAAALPIVYTTAYYALEQLAKIKRGDRVLIHAAAGGVGLAAIELCQRIGATIYATCSDKKRAYLESRGVKHSYSSRDTHFATAILKDTRNKGIDVVLNSLTSEGFIEASLECLKKGGVFLEIGKRNIYTREQMRPDVEYHIIALDTLAAENPAQVGELLEVIKTRIDAKELHPLPIECFNIERSISAFDRLQRAKNIGKIVITQSAMLRPEAHLLITGGLGALGMLLTQWLHEQGVAHLSVISRRAPEHSESYIDYYQADITDSAQVQRVIAKAHKKHPLTGIFHLAGVLDDGVFAEQTLERFKKVWDVKALGALNLHEASKDIPLDYFVLFSSIASSMGSAGQTNYAAANSFLDQLAEYRQQLGMPAQSIQWGPWLEAGMAAHLVDEHAHKGFNAFKTQKGLMALNTALHSAFPVIQVADINWNLLAKRGTLAPWMTLMAKNRNASAQGQLVNLLQQVDKSERHVVLLTELTRLIEEILGARDIAPDKGFFDLGMDSLMAVEMRNRIQQALGTPYNLSNTLLFDHPTLFALTEHLQQSILFEVFEQEKQTRLAPVLQQAMLDDPIAIIGMDCFFPGGANNPELFWQLLSQGHDGISEVPEARWDIDSYYDPDPDAPGKMVTRQGGFIQYNVQGFDAAFFNVSPKEAQMMDPQQRLLLETTWAALEHSSINPVTLQGSQTGVYIGISTNDYEIIQKKQSNEALINAYMGTGTSFSVAAGRIAYILGLQGPTLAVDTACSSSLVAVHLACKGLSQGEINMAIVGGVNLMLAPDNTIVFSKAHMLAADGYCKTFDEKADGYVRGEGCGVIILKRLSDAQRDNDRILALIKGSAVNQDGASSGLTVPNGSAQEELIRNALAHAQTAPETIDFIEAHGTGTHLGDPIEMRALSVVMTGCRDADNPLVISSVKTAIGHLEAASGIAGLIKTVLSLQHQYIPKHQHFSKLNPLIDLASIPAIIPVEGCRWEPHEDKPRRAGVSSFGFSGTNAHVIVEEAPRVAEEHAVEKDTLEYYPFILSAKTEDALKSYVKKYQEFLEANANVALGDLCYTLQAGRELFAYCLLLEVKDLQELLSKLSAKNYTIISKEQLKESVLLSPTAYRKITLPHYPFDNNTNYWIDINQVQEPALFDAHMVQHELLQSYRRQVDDSWVFMGKLSLSNSKWLADHYILKEALLPAASFIECFYKAVKEIEKNQNDQLIELTALSLEKVLVCTQEPVHFEIHIKEENKNAFSLQFYHFDTKQQAWILNAAARAAVVHDIPSLELLNKEPFKDLFVDQNHYDFYPKLAEKGFEYGEYFRVVNKLYLENNEIIAYLKTGLSDKRSTVSPVLLDGAFQLSAMLIYQNTHANDDSFYLPVGARRILFYRNPGNRMYVKTTSHSVEDDFVFIDIQLFDLQGRCCGLVDGLTLKKVNKTYLKEQLYPERAIADFLYTLEWEEIKTKNSTVISSPKYLALLTGGGKTCNALWKGFWEDYSINEYKEAFALLNQHAIYYFQCALLNLGFNNVLGYEFNLMTLQHELSIVPEFTRLLQRVLSILCQQGYLQVKEQTYSVCHVLDKITLSEPPQGLKKYQLIEYALVQRCGERLASILQGKESALALLFPKTSDLASAADLYKNSLGAQGINTTLANTLKHQLQQWPKDKLIRILEIGAGTGGTTSYLLPVLDGYHFDYVFTDIGKSFLDEAKRQFNDKRLLFTELNIEEDPRDQCFAPAQFDLIIAANVLHATQNMHQTLAHTRLLLAPKGQLILYELIRPEPWLDITFGLLDGWWCFEDTDLRQEAPLLTLPQWDVVLQESGFESIEYLKGGEISSGLIFATAKSGFPLLKHHSLPWLLVTNASVEHTALEQKLKDALLERGEQATILSITELNDSTRIQVRGVIYLPALLASSIDSLTVHGLMDVEKSLCVDFIRLAKAIATNKIQTHSLWVFTRGTQFISSGLQDKMNPVAATLWGMTHSLRHENSSLNCYCVDLSPEEELGITSIITSIYQQKEINQWAIRQDKFYALKLMPKKVAPHSEHPVNFEKTQIITGGTGDLGLALASYLIGQGANDIVLISRKEPSAEQQKQIDLMNKSAKRQCVFTLSLDISNPESLKKVFGSKEIGYVFHAAGSLRDALFMNQSWEKYQEVYQAKIAGTLGLYAFLKERSFDGLIFFSSMAAVLGPLGQSAHAGANSFLDSFAYYLRTHGYPVQTINWGAWSHIGYAARHGADKVVNATLGAIAPEEGLAILSLILTNMDWVQTLVSPIHWINYQKQLGSLPYWLSHFAHKTKSNTAISLIVKQLEQAPKSKQEELLTDFLQQKVAEVLNVADASTISKSQGLFNLGMDSLMAVSLRNQIQAAMGDLVQLPTTWAFEHSNVEQMTESLLPLFHDNTQGTPKSTQVLEVSQEPIAVIGMACRFPKGANSLSQFWEKLVHGEHGVGTIPEDRWNIDEFYNPDPDVPHKMYTRQGGFLDIDVRLFDADFFDIIPKEAVSMDPQQRVLLEVVWEALEDAGIPPSTLANRSVGLFLGEMNHDYALLLHDAGEQNAYVGSGTAASATAGRISYILNLQGPCMAIDTACSSSLVALNSAIQSMHSGDSELSIVAGVNLMLHPETTINMCQAKMLSPEGACKTFDASADGFIRGEGCGVLILKPLSQAERDKNKIWGIIRASTVNQDGASSGLTVPSAKAQEKLIRHTLAKAGLKPEDIDYIEAHGTGTKLGDPIEVRALTEVFGQRANKNEKPIIISSTKTYTGHLESAAGVVGIIRTLLSMHHQYIPKHLHLNELNPALSLEEMNAQIPVNPINWPTTGKPKRAGVSSFGFSGVNAHVILEEAEIKPEEVQRITQEAYLFVLSAKTPKALDAYREQFIRWLEHAEDIPLEDIGYSLLAGRELFQENVLIVAATKEELLNQLKSQVYLDEHTVINHISEAIAQIRVGKKPNIETLYPKNSVLMVALPSYAFQRKPFWIKESVSLIPQIQQEQLLIPENIEPVFIDEVDQMTDKAYDEVVSIVRETIMKLTYLTAEELNNQKGFVDSGFDSLIIVELAKQLKTIFPEKELTGATLYNFSNIDALARYLFEEEKITSLNTDVIQDMNEDIAIIGMSCRLPGHANSPEEFWDLLIQKKNAVTEVSEERKELCGINNDEEQETWFAGFIDEVDQFDPEFFGISHRAAKLMDPQQRLLLILAHEGLEHAGISSKQLVGAKVGVFIGATPLEYKELIEKYTQLPVDNVDCLHQISGNLLSALANRISYTLGLQGPAITVDTACSSSLTALHLACESIKAGECDFAICGGININFSYNSFLATHRAGLLSPSHTCKTFDNSADGFARGEGAGIVILKRCSAAENNHDAILAVVKSTAVNQDGASSGFTAPNGLAQMVLLEDALAKAQLEPDDISFFETHGTGTFLGDPIEFNAIKGVYNKHQRAHSLYLGALKSNIGHAEAASGIASIIKVILSLQHQEIVPNINFHQQNEQIKTAGTLLKFPLEITPWNDYQNKRRAAINAFGLTGTNAHCILEEYSPVEKDAAKAVSIDNLFEPPVYMLCFSAPTKEALDHYYQILGSWIDQHPEVKMSDLAFTVNARRTFYAYREVVYARSPSELKQKLHTKEMVHLEHLNESVSASYPNLKAPHDTETWKTIYEGIATQFLLNKPVHFDELEQPFVQAGARKVVSLPAVPLKLNSYWIDFVTDPLFKTASMIQHPFLISSRQLSNKEHVFSAGIKLNTPEHSYLKDHLIFNNTLFPAAGFLECLLASAREIKAPLHLEDVYFSEPLVLANKTEMEIILSPSSAGYEASIAAFSANKEWQTVVSAKIKNKKDAINQELITEKLNKKWIEDLESLGFYEQIKIKGIVYGPFFQVIKSIAFSDSSALCTLESLLDHSQYCVLPVILDGAFQSVAMLIARQKRLKEITYLPFGIEQLVYFNEHPIKYAYAELIELTDKSSLANIWLLDEHKNCCVQVLGLQLRAADKRSIEASIHQQEKDYLLYQEWVLANYSPLSVQGAWMLVDCPQLDFTPYLSGETVNELSSAQYILFGAGLHLPALQQITYCLRFMQEVIKNKISAHIVILTQNQAPLYQTMDEKQSLPSGLIGFYKTLMLEFPNVPCTLLDIAEISDLATGLSYLYADVIAVRGEQVYVNRLVKREEESLEIPEYDYQLIKDDASFLKFTEQTRKDLAEDEVEVALCATGINFRDVLNALNLYPGAIDGFGSDGAGIVTRLGKNVSQFKLGDKVYGIINGGFSRYATANQYLLAQIPHGLSFAQAAGIPGAFLTAYRALQGIAQLKKGDKVLIHAATGGVGLAAVQIAQQAGAEIFATCSKGKHEYLHRMGITHIYDSRSTDFAQALLDDTAGQGVDVLLNSLTSEGFIQASLACLKHDGTFIEIGKRNILTVEDMAELRQDVAYHILALDSLCHTEPRALGDDLCALNKSIQQHVLQPLPINNYSLNEVKKAVYFLKEARQIGKVVVSHPPVFTDKGSMIITGGTGALGRVLCDYWLQRGVKHIVLLSRSCSKDTEEWLQQFQGAVVHHAVDISDMFMMKYLLEQINAQNPIHGIFHLAGVLDDAVLLNQSAERVIKVWRPKAQGAEILHHLAQELTLDLHYFVLFSSVAASMGSPGQINYSAANNYLDQFALHRQRLGLSALSINWGAWANAGMASELIERHKKQGIIPLDKDRACALLDRVLSQAYPLVQIAPIHFDVFAKEANALAKWLEKMGVEPESEEFFKPLLLEKPREQRQSILQYLVMKEVKKILGLSDSYSLKSDIGFFDMGMDSLMAVALQNKIQKKVGFEKKLESSLLFEQNTIDKLTQYLIKEFFSEEIPLAAETINELTNEELIEMAKKQIKG